MFKKGSSARPNRGRFNWAWLKERRSKILSSNNSGLPRLTADQMTPIAQESALRLGSTLDVTDLGNVLLKAASQILPNVVDVMVLILDKTSQTHVYKGVRMRDPKTQITFPSNNKGDTCVSQGRRYLSAGSEASDPLVSLLRRDSDPRRRDEGGVLCSPVTDGESDEVVALIAAVCGELNAIEEQNLTLIEKHGAVAYRRIQQVEVMKLRANVRRDSADLAILRLCEDLFDKDATTLQIKVLKYLQDQTDSELCFLLLVGDSELVCQCVSLSETPLPHELRLGVNETSFSRILDSGRTATLADVSLADREIVAQTFGVEVTTMLCVPVHAKLQVRNIIAIACLCNKIGAPQYSIEDEKEVRHCFRYTTSVLTSTLMFQKEERLKMESSRLLNITKKLFLQMEDVTNLLKEIMEAARDLTVAERCSLFLVEGDQLVATVFDGITAGQNSPVGEIRIPISQGIAGHVAGTGKTLNIRDVYSHPLFYRGLDAATGFKTRNILCFPIKDENERVVGVAQLCNKYNGPHFTTNDMVVAENFSIYCGLSIVHSLLYKKTKDSQQRSKLANELMMYHMSQVTTEEVAKLNETPIPCIAKDNPEFSLFKFPARMFPDCDSVSATLSMFQEMGLITKYRIRKITLIRFCLMVRKGYRDTPYHNWGHAFSVAHFCYLLYTATKGLPMLNELEVLALFVSCLCHDLDHRGTNNAFQVSSNTTLASLYSSQGSVLERHHFQQTVCIINTEGCNIFENFAETQYEETLDLMKLIILATDLAHHFKLLPEFHEMAKRGYDRSNPAERRNLLCLLMSSCDLSDSAKEWDCTKRTAEMLYQEFFKQGDLEKAVGSKPQPLMDRETANIPDQQIEFIYNVPLPIFGLVTQLLPGCEESYQAVLDNIERWKEVRLRTKGRNIFSNGRLVTEDVNHCEETDSNSAAKKIKIINEGNEVTII